MQIYCYPKCYSTIVKQCHDAIIRDFHVIVFCVIIFNFMVQIHVRVRWGKEVLLFLSYITFSWSIFCKMRWHALLMSCSYLESKNYCILCPLIYSLYEHLGGTWKSWYWLFCQNFNRWQSITWADRRTTCLCKDMVFHHPW